MTPASQLSKKPPQQSQPFSAMPQAQPAAQTAASPSLSQPQQYTQAAFDQAKTRLDPQWEQSRKRFDQQMINKGLAPGSEAYKAEFDNFNRAKSDAYSTANFGAMQLGEDMRRWGKSFDLNEFTTYDGINRAYNDQSYRDAVFNASREDTKYNQLASLMGGIPVQGASPLNVQGAYGSENAAKMNNYNNQMSQHQGMMNNVAQIGSAALLLSSKDAKDHKQPAQHDKLAKAILDLPVESWQYKGDSEKHVGTYAEDFNQAIGKGPEPMIHQGDYNGAMLAALKDFDRRLKSKEAA